MDEGKRKNGTENPSRKGGQWKGEVIICRKKEGWTGPEW